MAQPGKRRYGWYGTVHSFFSVQREEWLAALYTHHNVCMNTPPHAAQVKAWEHCFDILQRQLAALVQLYPSAGDWTILFEYELPRERGRRPDVILLAGATIFVLEFKDFNKPLQAHVDQVVDYARDLQHYHAESHGRILYPVLVLTRSATLAAEQEGVHIVSPGHLVACLRHLVTQDTGSPVHPATWIQAEYSPLPSLVEAARMFFQHEPLPQIRRAHSAGISETVAELTSLAQEAHARNERHLVLITGVPGAGKTLLGLQLVHSSHLVDTGHQRLGIFLSGNGPLVKVLQYALKSRIFVQDIHGFLKEYGGSQQRCPEEHIWVYDEAQRAWDRSRVLELRGHGVSEPEDLLCLGERMQSWALIVGLVGEGQEIYLGEEAGIGLWNEALSSTSQQWFVHCPPKIAHLFTGTTVQTSEKLDLTISLRSHVAGNVQLWVQQVLEGNLSIAARTAQGMIQQGFHMYITRDLKVAKDYACERYQEQESKRYGLLASSRATNLATYSIHNDYNTARNLRIGAWYNDPPSSTFSCCQLRDVVREFDCQGLELDLPIVAWGNDLVWRHSNWFSRPEPRSKAHNPHRLRLNSYRVLLSRGRDGLVVFVPREQEMDTAYEALSQSGLQAL
jgi:hypothetical protein